MKSTPVEHAELSWNEQGTPVSRAFEDVYFSNDNGLEETRYVFLGGNQFPQRFAHHERDLLIVAESGFGTGLNFLTLWQAFEAFRIEQPNARLQRLHFISFEKFPLTQNDLIAALRHWPELAPWAEQLQQQWPIALPGCQRLLFDGGRITLDLWLGDINALIHSLDDSLYRQVDAWFLDGFAPRKTPICGRQRCLTPWQHCYGMAARLPRLPPLVLSVVDYKTPVSPSRDAKVLDLNAKC